MKIGWREPGKMTLESKRAVNTWQRRKVENKSEVKVALPQKTTSKGNQIPPPGKLAYKIPSGKGV